MKKKERNNAANPRIETQEDDEKSRQIESKQYFFTQSKVIYLMPVTQGVLAQSSYPEAQKKTQTITQIELELEM